MGLFSKLKIGRDDSGYVTNELPWGQILQMQKVRMDAGVEEILTVPAWVYHVKYTIAPGGIVWCGHGDTPLVAASLTFTNEASELNPILRPALDYLGNRISKLRLLSENDTFVSVIFYSKNDSETTK